MMNEKNKKGWIRIVEAFVAILLIAGISLMVIGRDYIIEGDSSSDIYEIEISILREIELNNSMRTAILGTDIPLNHSDFPSEVRTKIAERIPYYLDWAAKICEPDSTCEIGINLEKDIYVQSVLISANETTYSPRQLKLFCWEK